MNLDTCGNDHGGESVRDAKPLGEFREYWPNLFGAWLGVATGLGLNAYLVNIFAPSLVREFGWSKSTFAMYGSISLISVFLLPLTGGIVDRLGARNSATIGFIFLPLCLIAYTFMSGEFGQFLLISVVLQTFGALTSAVVFGRVVVERFHNSRGMALGIALSGASLMAAVVGPLIGSINETYGWRVGYYALALITSVGGACAIALVGWRGRKAAKEKRHRGPPISYREFRELVRQPAFLLLLGGMFMINIPYIVITSQLNLVLIERGMSFRVAVMAASSFGVCVFMGRFICGFLLDRVPAHVLAFVILSVPAAGYMVLLSQSETLWLLFLSVMLIGLAHGAEMDIAAYMSSKTFDIRRYSLIYSFIMAAYSLAILVGSIGLSVSLDITDRFDVFLFICLAVTLLGSLCFLRLGKYMR